MVSIGAEGARNVQIFDAELPKTANPFCGRFHVTEYGFMRESKLNISKLLKPQSDYYQRQLKWNPFLFFSGIQNHLFISDAYFHFCKVVSFVRRLRYDDCDWREASRGSDCRTYLQPRSTALQPEFIYVALTQRTDIKYLQ